MAAKDIGERRLAEAMASLNDAKERMNIKAKDELEQAAHVKELEKRKVRHLALRPHAYQPIRMGVGYSEDT